MRLKTSPHASIFSPKKHHRRPQRVGGFKKGFEEQGQAHEKRIRNPNSPNNTLFGEKCKMRLPATKGNKKRGKLGDKMVDKTSGRGTHANKPSNTKADPLKNTKNPLTLHR